MNFLSNLKQKIYGNKTASECVVYTIVFMVFSAFAFSYVFVLLWCFISGMRTHEAIVDTPFYHIFSELEFSKIFSAFSSLEVANVGFVGMLINSLYFSITSVSIQLLTTATFAYVTTKYEFPGSKLVYPIVMVMMFLPLYGSGGAAYKLYHTLGLINNPLSAIATATVGTGVNYLYFNAFYRGLSNTYKEAAEIDGANEWQIFFKVIFPQAMGLVGALFLTMWIGGWNGYEGFLIYFNKLPNLAAGIYMFSKETHRNDVLFAACFIVSVPPIILFACFTKVLTNNVSLGGIKE